MQKNLLIIIIVIILTAIIVGGAVYFWQSSSFAKEKQQLEKLVQDLNNQIQNLQSQLDKPADKNIVSEKEATYNLFKDLVDWRINENTDKVFIGECVDSKPDCPLLYVSYPVYELSYGPIDPAIGPQIDTMRSILQSNGWIKCTQGVEPPVRDTYIKNCKKLQLNIDGSQGVGYLYNIQFEYSD